ncbi:MAG: hypothetical protein WBO82_07310 [Neisseria sp.]
MNVQNNIPMVAKKPDIQLKKETLITLSLVLLAATQAYAGTDDLLTEAVDFWVNFAQGTGGKLVLAVCAFSVAIAFVVQKYVYAWALIAIFLVLAVAMPLLIGAMPAVIPVTM